MQQINGAQVEETCLFHRLLQQNVDKHKNQDSGQLVSQNPVRYQNACNIARDINNLLKNSLLEYTDGKKILKILVPKLKYKKGQSHIYDPLFLIKLHTFLQLIKKKISFKQLTANLKKKLKQQVLLQQNKADTIQKIKDKKIRAFNQLLLYLLSTLNPKVRILNKIIKQGIYTNQKYNLKRKNELKASLTLQNYQLKISKFNITIPDLIKKS